MALFLFIVLAVWLLQHGFVFWRLSSLAWFSSFRRRLGLWLAAVLLFSSYPAARFAYARGWDSAGLPLEIVGGTWVGMMFLFFAVFLFLEISTGFGFFFRPWLARLRLWAVLVVLLMSLVGVIQGQRDPVITERELSLPGLPKELSGLRVALLTDLHLGIRFDAPWLARQVGRLNEVTPDMVLLAGDVIDHDLPRARPILPLFRGLHARLGTWAVLGNHDYYAGGDATAEAFGLSGIGVLRDASAQVSPGLWLAGVDDLPSGSRLLPAEERISRAFAGVPKGAACIYLSHTPVLAELAAAKGAGLMLSGHTHAGQLWPFGLLVRQRFPLFEGLYTVEAKDSSSSAGPVDRLNVLVSRGAGGWGPRMRLWKPSEIILITLRP